MVDTDLKDVKEIVSTVKELQGNIKDLVEIFSKLPSGKHRGVSGDLELTTKEKEVLKLIQREQERADQVVNALTQAIR
ncbi:MAG: hypothetical protein HYS08_08970 [Chlamydiae bacterium]|nr:hypothetical protein [Chlamydiota bacterium]MBI3265493.1 hypothetical protein [Chlamydiota bacterium]